MPGLHWDNLVAPKTDGPLIRFAEKKRKGYAERIYLNTEFTETTFSNSSSIEETNSHVTAWFHT